MINDINSKNPEPTQFKPETYIVGGKKATVTEEGKISIEGKTYSVKFGGEGSTKLTVPQRQALAAKVLEILQQTGKKFATLDKMSIQSEKITHYTTEGEAKTLKPGMFSGSWAKTAKKTIEYCKNLIAKKQDDDFEDDINNDEDNPISNEIELYQEQSNNQIPFENNSNQINVGSNTNQPSQFHQEITILDPITNQPLQHYQENFVNDPNQFNSNQQGQINQNVNQWGNQQEQFNQFQPNQNPNQINQSQDPSKSQPNIGSNIGVEKNQTSGVMSNNQQDSVKDMNIQVIKKENKPEVQDKKNPIIGFTEIPNPPPENTEGKGF